MLTSISLAGILALLVTGSYVCINKKNKEITWKETIAAYIAYMLLLFLFMAYTGVLQSGYHFVDDHEMYTFSKDFAPYGYWGAMLRRMQIDLHSRFRFTYYLVRITECYFFRDNYLAWHIFQTIVAGTSLWLCYIFARLRRCPVWLSFGFSVAVFIGGGQSAVLWRLGPQECLGTLILMVTLLLLLKYAQTSSKVLLAASIISTIFLGGIKEAFLLMLPVLPVLLAYWRMIKEGTEITIRNLIHSLRNAAVYTVVTYAVFIIDLLIIVLYVGTNRYGYAGIDQTYGILDYLKGFYHITTGRLGLYLRWSLYGSVFLLLPMWIGEYRRTDRILSFWRQIWLPVMIFAYLMAAQYVLHAKSTMYERYLLPSTCIISAFWLIFVFHICKETKWQPAYHMFALLMVIALIHGVDDENRGRQYAEDGQNTTAMIEFVGATSDRKPKVIVDIDYEMDLSAAIILQDKYQLSSVYNINYNSTVQEGYARDGYVADEEEEDKIPITAAEIYMGYPDKLEKLMEECDMDISEYDKRVFGDYVVLIRR